ncbi:MAG: hypothetical protein RLZZ214_4116 [Verrucomicrobiota bacterium]|jgi:DNA repair photolyase
MKNQKSTTLLNQEDPSHQTEVNHPEHERPESSDTDIEMVQSLPAGMSGQVSSNTSPRPPTLNSKPVLYRDGDTILTDPSEEFHEKLLCDGLVFNCGDACGFSCTYCFSESSMFKIDKPIIDAHNRETGQELGYQDVVIRRRNGLEFLRSQLLNEDGSRIYSDPDDTRVIYSSTIVDPAPNMDLLKETAAACLLILKNTAWQIRLLSKSPLLARLVEKEMIPKEYHHRLILGFSIGTLDDEMGAAIEIGTGKVSMRIKALHWLQDHGFRVFGMICPSLPQEDYDAFSREICAAIRVEKCEHVWAEVINVRGDSLTKTTEALRNPELKISAQRKAELAAEATRLESVSGADNKEAWEEYARQTFLAHTKNIPAEKLRFLQYITAESADWWKEQRANGAVLIGEEAKKRLLIAGGESARQVPLPPLEDADIKFRNDREEIVATAVTASIAAAKALHEIKTYRDGLLWKTDFLSFDRYCEAKWGYQKSHAYRLVDTGSFIAELADSPQGENVPQPLNAGQIRPLIESVPKPHRVECWNKIMTGKDPAEFTGPMIADEARKFVRKHKLATKAVKPARVSVKVRATRELGRLRSILGKLPQPQRFDQLLLGIEILINQDLPGTDDGLEPTDTTTENSLASGRPTINPDVVAEAMAAADPVVCLPEDIDGGAARLLDQYHRLILLGTE